MNKKLEAFVNRKTGRKLRPEDLRLAYIFVMERAKQRQIKKLRKTHVPREVFMT